MTLKTRIAPKDFDSTDVSVTFESPSRRELDVVDAVSYCFRFVFVARLLTRLTKAHRGILNKYARLGQEQMWAMAGG